MNKKVLCFAGVAIVIVVTLATTIPVRGIAAGPNSSVASSHTGQDSTSLEPEAACC